MYKFSRKFGSHAYAIFTLIGILTEAYNNGIIVFICTDAWAPICIFLYVSGRNESVQLKPIGSLVVILTVVKSDGTKK